MAEITIGLLIKLIIYLIILGGVWVLGRYIIRAFSLPAPFMIGWNIFMALVAIIAFAALLGVV